jgi:hypothetical protein
MTKVHLHPSEETLMAYADGELDEDVAVAVERAMTDDPALVRELVAFTRSRRLARAVMSHGHVAASTQLISAVSVLTSPADDGSERARRRWLSGLLPSRGLVAGASAAATILAIAAGGFGYWLGAWPPAATRTALSHLDDPDVSAVLHKLPSGDRQRIAGGVLNPLATYQLADGTLCRDYELADGQTRAEALACRHKNGWRTVAAVAAPVIDGYTPASRESLIDSYLQQIKAGEPLSPEDEGRLFSPE